ncbi:MAG TPA: hypothetical protein VJ939_07095, partial [Bacteroidales bacterium]|nr:hypothetical protein [Bacteroidales bacterium]
MSDLLQDIEEQTGFYFSFSPDDFKDRFLKVRFIDRSLSYILEQIFEDQFAYLKNGSEIIVFKNRTPEEGDTSEIADEASPDPVAEEENIQAPREIIRIDTVYKVLRDTLFLKDTVYITDTVLVRDTIYKQKVVKNAHRNNISFRNTLIDDNRPAFYLDAYYAPVIGSTVYGGSNEELSSVYSGAFEDRVSYAAGLNGGVVKNGFIAETGLAIRMVRNKLNYTFNKPDESFYEVDTLDSYYTVADSDTSWFFVTDSSLQVIPGYNEFYQNTNVYTFLDIPFNLGYQLNINRFDLEFRAGISLGFLLSKQGYYIADEELYPVKNLDNLESKVA